MAAILTVDPVTPTVVTAVEQHPVPPAVVHQVHLVMVQVATQPAVLAVLLAAVQVQQQVPPAVGEQRVRRAPQAQPRPAKLQPVMPKAPRVLSKLLRRGV